MKDLFLLDPSIVFLNHGSFGACPREVLAVCQDWQMEMERNPVAFLARRSGALLADARAALGSSQVGSPSPRAMASAGAPSLSTRMGLGFTRARRVAGCMRRSS